MRRQNVPRDFKEVYYYAKQFKKNPRGLSVEGGKGNPGEACKAGSLLVLVICLMIRGAGEPEQ